VSVVSPRRRFALGSEGRAGNHHDADRSQSGKET
jgi:hypothetical protein